MKNFNISINHRAAVIAFILIFAISFTFNMNKKEKIGLQDFYVGTYTNKESKGIYKFLLNENGELEKAGLAAPSENPSFLCKSNDGKYLIAVNEISNKNSEGTIESFLIKNDTLLFINRSTTGGAHPCYVGINADGFILTANYTGGNIGLLKLNSTGRLSDLLDTRQHQGRGTTDRQKGPHAHSAIFSQEGDRVISADLGTNELWFYNLDTAEKRLIPSIQNKLSMPPGAGPRHLSIHPDGNWIYVINELNNKVAHLNFSDDGVYESYDSYSTLPENFSGVNYGADIHITSDGKFLYASNRGHNSIVIFEIDETKGSLKLIGHESTRGEWPRNFSLSRGDEFLLVANQHSNNIVSFKRDKNTGLLEYVDVIACPTPVNILF